MPNPIPQQIPKELVGTEQGAVLLELIRVADQIRAGVPVNPVPSTNDPFLFDVSEVLRQLIEGNTPNPLPSNLPNDPFYVDFVNAIETLR